jgi:hypothetical protein
MRTLKQLAQEALDIQDACNPIGLSNGIGRAMSDLMDLLRKTNQRNDTAVICSHPIFVLWASKLHSLAGLGISDIEKFGIAYDECCSMANAPDTV